MSICGARAANPDVVYLFPLTGPPFVSRYEPRQRSNIKTPNCRLLRQGFERLSFTSLGSATPLLRSKPGVSSGPSRFRPA